MRSLQEKVIRLERTIAQREVEANFLIDGLTEVEGENTRILVLRPATDLDINITSRDALSARRIGSTSGLSETEAFSGLYLMQV